MNEPDATILIGLAEALSAPEVAWSLLDAGWKVAAFARRGSSSPLRKCVGVNLIEITSPETNRRAAVDDLRQAARDHAVSAIMPLDDVSVLICSEVVSDFQGYLLGPVGQAAKIAVDKQLQIQLARQAGFSVPSTESYESIDLIDEHRVYPCILKPAIAVAERQGQLVRPTGNICANPVEFARAKHRWPAEIPVLVQPFITGVGEGLFGIATTSGIYVCSGHRRIRMMNPQGSGSSACRSIPVDSALANCAARMLKDCSWRGMFMIEILRDSAGEPWFMELNGRPWGSMALARRMGYEYPAWWARMAMDPTFHPESPKNYEPITCRHLGREILHLAMVFRGPQSKALLSWPSRWETIRNLFSVRRSDRWYNWRRDNPAVFFDDTFQTVLRVVRPKVAKS